MPLSVHEAVVLAVVRDGQLYRFDDEAVATLQVGDRLVELVSHRH